jgi:predicted  nucleic acid-binding Zn-ribbon protein
VPQDDSHAPEDLCHHPTPAELAGRSAVKQCQHCGTLVASTSPLQLGPCPVCSGHSWTRQPVNVGPFRRHDTDRRTLEQSEMDATAGRREADL